MLSSGKRSISSINSLPTGSHSRAFIEKMKPPSRAGSPSTPPLPLWDKPDGSQSCTKLGEVALAIGMRTVPKRDTRTNAIWDRRLILQPHLGRKSFDLTCVVRSLGSCLMASSPDGPIQHLCGSNQRLPHQSIHQSADFWNGYRQESGVELPLFRFLSQAGSVPPPDRPRPTSPE